MALVFAQQYACAVQPGKLYLTEFILAEVNKYTLVIIIPIGIAILSVPVGG